MDDSAKAKPRPRQPRLITAVVLGLVVLGSPSALYILSLHSVSQARVGATVRVIFVLLLVVIVLLLAELPIGTYAFAPERTTAAQGRERVAGTQRPAHRSRRDDGGGLLLHRQGNRRSRLTSAVRCLCSAAAPTGHHSVLTNARRRDRLGALLLEYGYGA